MINIECKGKSPENYGRFGRQDVAPQNSSCYTITFSHTQYEMRPKRDCEKAVRTTISMPPELWKIAVQRQQQQCFPTFSDFIQALIRPTNAATQETTAGR